LLEADKNMREPVIFWVIEILPVTPNEPVIKADPVKGKGGT
jgi:hypothetical protein